MRKMGLGTQAWWKVPEASRCGWQGMVRGNVAQVVAGRTVPYYIRIIASRKATRHEVRQYNTR